MQILDPQYSAYSFFVFKDKSINYANLDLISLQNIISFGGVEIIACHYEQRELFNLFDGFEIVSSRVTQLISPNSGMKIDSLIAVLRKA